MERSTIENVREYKFDPKRVIEGLNGYYCESERAIPTRCFIRVYRNDVDGPVYLGVNVWLSALIEWLRVDHDIFYRPGLTIDQIEAARSAAKMCGLRAHIKDEISKRGLWCGADEDIPELVDTLFKAYDEEGERADENRKDVVKLSKENRELKEGVCEDIMKYIRHEASRNGFELPDEIDGEPLIIKRVFHDLLELLRKRGVEIRDAERETRKAVNDQLKKDTDYVADTLCDILETLGISKSDTVHLDIPELKNKAIQRASLIKSERDRYLKQRNTAVADYQAVNEKFQGLKDAVEQKKRLFAILQELYRDIFKKQPDGLSAEDIANRILEASTVNAPIAEYTRKECYDYLWNALKRLSPDCDALKIGRYEELVDRIFYEMSLIKDNCKACQKAHSTEKFDYIRRTNKAEEELKKLKEQNQERDTEIKNLKERIEELESDFKAVCDEDDIFRTRALKAEEELKKLKTGQKSDINKLIRDYCAEFGIIAPSRYLSDEACVEYLCGYLRSLDNRAVDVEKRAYENILFYLISYWENLGYDRHDILFGDYRNRSITLTIENLINKYAEKDRQAQTCDVELKRARDTIDTLKCLMDNVNTELEDY